MCVIPAIAFDSGINTDWHTLKRNFGQVLLLAGPGIVIIAICVAVIFKEALGYEGLSWSEALLVGSILAATDPVAVIAMLKEVGASDKISVIIDGESLMNDGTAMVFFHVMGDIVKTGSFDVGEVVGLFFRLTLGAWACGFLFAMVMYLWFRRLTDDIEAATGLTLFGSYLLFLLCEGTIVEMSGILAICSMSFFLSGFSAQVISPLVKEPLHHIWAFIGWVAETFLFVLAGAIIGGKVLHSGHIEGTDWPLLLLHYVLLTLARILMLGVFYPILKRLGYSINWRSFIIFVHAGLRGGVCLALSLIVWTDTEYSELLRDKLIFHASGIVVLTVVLNGCTGKWLLQTVGLAENSKEEEIALNDAAQRAIRTEDAVKAKVMASPHLSSVDWDRVIKRTKRKELPEEIIKTLTIGKRIHRKLVKSSGKELLTEYEGTLASVTSEGCLVEARVRFLQVLQARYNHYHARGMCLPPTYVYLTHQTDISRDHVHDRLDTWDVVQPTVLHSLYARILLCLRQIPVVKNWTHKELYKRLAQAYDRCLAFHTAHEEAWRGFQAALPTLTATVIHDLHSEVLDQLRGCQFFIRNLLSGYQQIVTALQERTAEVLILHSYLEAVEKDCEEGFISMQEAELISRPVDSRLWKIYHPNPIQHFPDILDCVSFWPLLKSSPEDFLKELLRLSTVSLVLSDQELYSPKQPLNWVYLVLHGTVLEKTEEGVEFEHEPGALIGAHYLFSKEEINTVVRTNTWVFMRILPVSGVKRLLGKYEKEVWTAAFPALFAFKGNAWVTKQHSATEYWSQMHIPQIPNLEEQVDRPLCRDGTEVLIQQSGRIPLRAEVISVNEEMYERWKNSGRDLNAMSLQEIERS